MLRGRVWLKALHTLLPCSISFSPQHAFPLQQYNSVRGAVTQAIDEAQRARLGFAGGGYSLDEFPVERIRYIHGVDMV